MSTIKSPLLLSIILLTGSVAGMEQKPVNAPFYLKVSPSARIRRMQAQHPSDESKYGNFFKSSSKSDVLNPKVGRSLLDKQEQPIVEEKSVGISRTTSSELGAHELVQLMHKRQATLVPPPESIKTGDVPSTMRPPQIPAAAQLAQLQKIALIAEQEKKRQKREQQDIEVEKYFKELEARVAAAKAAEGAKK
jgi:hypothetical protein